jgi:subtilisin family serine protease
LADKEVAVITISLAGPQNELMEAAIAALVARGHVVVAAAGNDGPAAPPVYPAAYPGVVAVTSVDTGRHLQLDAGRGPHIAFAALGVEVDVALPGGSYTKITGTSYAAPRVAAHFAAEMDDPDPAAAANAMERIKTLAIDLGTPGRDDSFGYGFLDSAAPTASLQQ